MDIHFRAAVRAVHQSGQQVNLTPSVRIAADIASDLLNQIKGCLIDDRLLCILKDYPVILRHIMTLLVLEMLGRLEIDGMPKILLLSQNCYHGGRTPVIRNL